MPADYRLKDHIDAVEMLIDDMDRKFHEWELLSIARESWGSVAGSLRQVVAAARRDIEIQIDREGVR